MSRSSWLAIALGMAASMNADPWASRLVMASPGVRRGQMVSHFGSRYISVAAMKRAARKRRNLRARSAK